MRPTADILDNYSQPSLFPITRTVHLPVIVNGSRHVAVPVSSYFLKQKHGSDAAVIENEGGENVPKRQKHG